MPKFGNGRLHGDNALMVPLAIPEQGPTPDAKLAAMGPNRLASLVRPCFVEAMQPDSKEGCIVLQSGSTHSGGWVLARDNTVAKFKR